MKHDEIPEMAAELYLMNELPAAERDAFKEHIADCAICATQVRAGFAIREQLFEPREVPDPMPAPERRPIRSRWHLSQIMPVAASFVIAVFGTYFAAVRPAQQALIAARQPGVASTAQLKMVRSEGQPWFNNSRGAALLKLTIEEDGRSTVYTYTIIGGTGQLLYTGTVSAEQVAEQVKDGYVPIVIPRGTLPPDDYTLRIDTKPRISTYLFRVRSD
jgi:anti-sigma factor RsiW